MALSPRSQRRRALNVLRVALRRVTSCCGTFSISEAGCQIDGMLLPDEIPESLVRLMARLVQMGLLASVGERYQVRPGGEVLLSLLSMDNKDSAQALGTLAEPMPLGKFDRIMGPDPFEDEPTRGDPAAVSMANEARRES